MAVQCRRTVATGSTGDSSVAELAAGVDLSVVIDLVLRSERLTHLSEEIGSCLSNLAKLDLSNDEDLSAVRDLSLRSKELTHLSEEIGTCLSNLAKLDLSNNNLEILQHSLHNLKSLTVTQDNLKTLPMVITQMWSLRVLQLSGNGIESLPDNLGDLKCLESLNVSFNKLKSLPESCVKLNQLKNLDLSGNNFKVLPDCLTRGMNALESLDVSGNMSINMAIAPATEMLKKLYIREAGRNVKFPNWVLRGRAPNLQVLDCDDTMFVNIVFPDDCPRLKLRILSLESCCIDEKFVQDIMSRTDQLETLRLGNIPFAPNTKRNAIWAIPIKHLNHPMLLTELSMRDVGLSIVCREIGIVGNLVKLDLSLNRISWLPDEICLLSKLEVLLVDRNDLDAFPNEIGRMTRLKELKADSNCLATLPKSIRDLKHLQYLDLYDNQFHGAPEELTYIDNLLGTDIEWNNFDTTDLCIRDLQYVALRSVIRDRYESPDNQRINGPRNESNTKKPIDADDTTGSFSEMSSITSDDQNSTVDENENNRKEEENWDTDNSADEFDPTWVSDEPPRQKYMPVLPRKSGFCPADYHVLPIKVQIAIARQKGEIQDEVWVEEEGQFDDA